MYRLVQVYHGISVKVMQVQSLIEILFAQCEEFLQISLTVFIPIFLRSSCPGSESILANTESSMGILSVVIGMSTGDIEAHIQDIYGISVSDSTVSLITDKILPIAKKWQQRPLESIYAVVFLDAIHYHVRSEGQIVKKAVYIAIGIDLDGRKDVLGMLGWENEIAKFWATVLNGLKNRGVEYIFIACTDNLTGFDAAIHATFPQT